MDMGKPTVEFFARLIMAAKIDNEIDEDINIYKNAKQCQWRGETFNVTKKFNDHIREDEDCSIYYTIDYLSRKKCPQEGCRTIWEPYKDKENTLNIDVA